MFISFNQLNGQVNISISLIQFFFRLFFFALGIVQIQSFINDVLLFWQIEEIHLAKIILLFHQYSISSLSFCHISHQIFMQQESMIAKKVVTILNKIQQAKNQFQIQRPVRLVAVSKTKSVQEITQAYQCGIRHFGENYVDEIEEKQPKLPLDIKWHFIGHLQTNKIKKMLVPNLFCIETVDRQSLAQKLNKALEKQNRKLNILIQVKTSEEESKFVFPVGKSGVELAQLNKLYEYIIKECPFLEFKGLMTIGAPGDIKAFQIMNSLKDQMCLHYLLDSQSFQLSMGMSADFQSAIQYHSTSVRIGSSIFGQRNYPKEK